MQAGQLRHVITIQKPIVVQDTLGQDSTAYENLYENVRAEVVPLSGREYVAARQVAAEVTTRILIRRVQDVDGTCRVLRTITTDVPPTVEVYDVLAALPDPVSGLRYMNLLCVQRFAEGFRRGEE